MKKYPYMVTKSFFLFNFIFSYYVHTILSHWGFHKKYWWLKIFKNFPNLDLSKVQIWYFQNRFYNQNWRNRYSAYKTLQKHLAINYKYIHVGLVQVGIKLLTKKGLRRIVCVCVCVKRHKKTTIRFLKFLFLIFNF